MNNIIRALENYSHKDKIVLLSGIVLFFLNFTFLFKISFVTSDDVDISVSTFNEMVGYAFDGGRLTWLWQNIFNLPSLGKVSSFYHQIPRFIYITSLFHATYLLINHDLENREKTLFILIFPIIFFVNNWQHHGFIGFSGEFALGLSLFIYSTYFLKIYEKTDQKIYLLFSSMAYIFSLLSELYPFLIIFLFFSIKSTIITRIKKIFPHILIFILFIVLYLLNYYHVHGMVQNSDYAISISQLVDNFFYTWYIYTFSQITSLTHNFITINNIRIIPYQSLLSILCISLILFLNIQSPKVKNNNKLIMWLWWFSIGLIVCAPIAATPKYQKWVADVTTTSYIYSALATFCLSLSIGGIALYFLEKFTEKKYSFWIVTSLLFVIIILIYLSNQFRSLESLEDQEKFHRKWIAIDRLAEKMTFANHTCYYIPTLYTPVRIGDFRKKDYWDIYLNTIWGLSSHFSRTAEPSCHVINLYNRRFPLKQWVGFDKNKEGINFVAEGIYSDERWSWAEGYHQAIMLDIKDDSHPTAYEVTLHTYALVNASSEPLQVIVKMAGYTLADWMIDFNHSSDPRTFKISKEILQKESVPLLEFEIINPRTPASLGLNNDTRLLSLAFVKMRIDPIDNE